MDKFVSEYCSINKFNDAESIDDYTSEIYDPDSTLYIGENLAIANNGTISEVMEIVKKIDWTDWFNLYVDAEDIEFTGFVACERNIVSVRDGRRYYALITARGDENRVASPHIPGSITIHSHPLDNGDESNHWPSAVDYNNSDVEEYSIVVTSGGVIIYRRNVYVVVNDYDMRYMKYSTRPMKGIFIKRIPWCNLILTCPTDYVPINFIKSNTYDTFNENYIDNGVCRNENPEDYDIENNISREYQNMFIESIKVVRAGGMLNIITYDYEKVIFDFDFDYSRLLWDYELED